MQQAYELCDREGDGNLQFDFLDGYDELEYVWTVPLSTIASVSVLTSSSYIRDHPDIQEKVRRCVSQAHIDPEDFKGVCLHPLH